MVNEKEATDNKIIQVATKFDADLTDYGSLCNTGFFQGGNPLTTYETLSAPCIFSRISFEDTLMNLIKNPNITSSHLFRADIFYDSSNDASYAPNDPSYGNGSVNISPFTQHMKPEYRPIPFTAEGYKLTRTLVRQLIPRNPNLDAPLVQTCHFLNADTGEDERTMVVYLPHVDSKEAMPFYHPAVQMLAFVHFCRPSIHDSETTSTDGKHRAIAGIVSIIASPFAAAQLDISNTEQEGPYNFSGRLKSTFLNLLKTIHKHATKRQLQNYTKRVNHDQVVPQKAFQDTYTQLKLNYAKSSIANWQETTDPGKHVFEDLGIAAFLIELWKRWYETSENQINTETNGEKFPGFVDIGCGNGLLVNLLRKEGYAGWGFDVRRRKSWATYDADIRQDLLEKVLVPYILDESTTGGEPVKKDRVNSTAPTESTPTPTPLAAEHFHGAFRKGTFIVSNHADELTAWTPILAYLSQCPFICIPCCSHDLSGARTRYAPTSGRKTAQLRLSVVNKSSEDADSQPKSGSLARPAPGKSSKMPSAYATLCDYVTSLAKELGFSVEKEMLRIPSTRNAAIVGRLPISRHNNVGDSKERETRVRAIVERELAKSIPDIRGAWLERASKIADTTGSGH